MQELLAALVSFFLIQPLEIEMADALAASRAPAAVAEQVTTCVRDAVPALTKRAIADPMWALGSAASFWVGLSAPADVLTDAAPGCAPAIAALQPFLDGDPQA